MNLDKLIRDVGDVAKLQRAVESHYDLEELTTGKLADRGKYKLHRKEFHGKRNAPETINALMMAFRAEGQEGGNVQQRGPTAYDKELRLAGSRMLSPAGASELAGVGLRGGELTNLDGPERLERALDRIAELDSGYNHITGAVYGDVGLDGGHKAAHALNPELSNLRSNMMFESQYENRVKGKASGDDLKKRIRNSLLKRLRSGELTPQDFVKSVNASGPISNY